MGAIKRAQRILAALVAAGYEAYMVGGAVRDLLLGRNHLDVDICTDAQPETIVAISAAQGWKTSAVGQAFGSIIVVVDGVGHDVTTFRTEEYGEDCHKPERVEFGASLKDDLARRDFTINTLCLDVNGDLIDLFGGLEDLRLGIIRAVGDPSVRFAEDGLRMFRAARFAAQFGFVLDKSIIPALIANTDRVRGLSVERVRNELESTLLGQYASRGLNLLLTTGLLGSSCRNRENGRFVEVPILPELEHLYHLPQNERYHRLDTWRHVLSAVDFSPQEITIRWAALLHDVAKGMPGVRGVSPQGELTDYHHDVVGVQMAEAILGRLRVEQAVAKRVLWLMRNHMYAPPPERPAVIRWLRRRSVSFADQATLTEAVEQLFALFRADAQATRHVLSPEEDALEQTVRPVLAEIPFYPSGLAISGGEIAQVLGAGPQVGNFQRGLMERIQSGKLRNEAEELKRALAIRARRLRKQLENGAVMG